MFGVELFAIYLLAGLFQLQVGVSLVILGLASTILNWVVSGFTTLPYTTGGIIDIGWPICRDLVNISFIIILVFIGLATALRLGEYQVKKTLPLFLIIALLINFTQVICGLIVDASNIVMNFFLAEGVGGSQFFASQLDNWGASITEGMKQFWNPLAVTDLLLKSVVISVFNLLAACVFSLFAFLFILRYVAIWILVILSPFAFAAYILPATRSFWKTWWNQFIQWCFIGVTCAFFLYLGDHMLRIVAQNGGYFSPVPPSGEGIVAQMGASVTSFINSLLGYGVALVFLCLGFFVAISTSAMGASGVIAATQKGAKAAGRRAATIGWERTRSAAAAVGAEAGRIRSTYQTQRAAGATRTEALKHTTGAYWATRAKPAMKAAISPKTYLKGAVAAGKGTLSAIRDIGEAGIRTAFGIPKAKKERPTCPVCGNYVPAKAKFCPHCKHKMPTCPDPKCRAPLVPGAKFCDRCGTKI